ncbi:MAG: hypothetical protein ACREBU_15545 [Nitrososphaera sp.]
MSKVGRVSAARTRETKKSMGRVSQYLRMTFSGLVRFMTDLQDLGVIYRVRYFGNAVVIPLVIILSETEKILKFT